jgi:hypothetical protein
MPLLEHVQLHLPLQTRTVATRTVAGLNGFAPGGLPRRRALLAGPRPPETRQAAEREPGHRHSRSCTSITSRIGPCA